MRIQIVLDTCVVRNIAHQNGAQLDAGAIRNNKEDLRFSLTDPTYLELHAALSEGRLSWEEWPRAAKFLDEILDDEWPILPSGAELHKVSGLFDGDFDRHKLQEFVKACWSYLAEASNAADLQREMIFALSDGRKFKIGGHAPKSSDARENEREEWIEFIESVRNIYDPKEWSQNSTTKAILYKLQQLEQWSTEQQRMMIPVVNMLARYIHLVQQKNGYKPWTDKNRGDVLDFFNLWYISFPAIVCTADIRFINKVSQAGVICGLVGVEELNERMKEDTVHQLLTAVTKMQEPMSDAG